MKSLFFSICFLLLISALSGCGETTVPETESGGGAAQEEASAPMFDGDLSGPDFGLELDPGFGIGGGSGGFAEIAPPIAILPLMFDNDMGITVGDTWFPIWQDATGLLEALGDDYTLESAPTCVFDEGDDKWFVYDGVLVSTNPLGGIDLWFSIYLENDTYATSRGIRVGSTLDDVIAVYGDTYYKDSDIDFVYSISGEHGDISSPCIIFTIEDSFVTAIEIYYPTNTA